MNLSEKLRKAVASNSAPVANLPSDVVDFPRRGRRLTADQIAEEFYGGHVGPEWVHDHVPGRCRISHRVVLWWEYDVLAHLEAERAQPYDQRRKTRRPRKTAA